MDAGLRREALERAVVAAMDAAGRSAMQWGRDDCALWCANILRQVLTYDGAARFRGRYRTKIGAHRVLGKAGLAAALREAARRHKWRRVKPGAELPGDIGLALISGVASTVICRAPGWFVGRNEAGFTALPTSAIRIIWAIV
ncbi:hypothetical protein [Bradyrhizobium sp. 153]|uniref:DUF6950 family protein n=1 Tax=Bradyrhizobium sp. 153 TaxID=2782627 RepID=UPI001FFA1397|nr:hypothetical protein [Bradyrhizobium sp. 153]MCK1669444.1 hypothetical protein [Bradyrhizobium sp. 153]